jgi:hypothetical protein
MGAIDQLMRIDDAILDWLMQASPNTDDERTQMRKVLAMRGDLDASINTLVARRLQLAVANIPEQTATLSKAVDAMNRVSKTISDVQQVLTVVGTAVQVAAQLVALVAAA